MTAPFCTPPATDAFAARLLSDTDCQAFGLVERGYAALAQPGGTISTALTGLLIIAVAFFGYRLLLGRGLILSDAVALTLKIGVVLLIATSWQSWQSLAYDGLARAPTQVAGDVLTGIGAQSPLDSLQSAIDSLANATVGYRMRAGIASPLVGGPAAAAAALNISSVLLTLSIVGMLVVFRVVLAVLLAIAPAMAGLLLFDGTRGMAQGWFGAMTAAALAPLFILIIAAVEFAILDPMIARLLAEQASGDFDIGLVMPIALVAVVFAVTIAVAVRAGTRIGFGIRLPRIGRSHAAVAEAEPARALVLDQQAAHGPVVLASAPGASRALQGIVLRERRTPVGAPAWGSTSRSDRNSGQGSVSVGGNRSVEPLTMFERPNRHVRTSSRSSRAARRRDG
ncbi:type IV secretion system protein [Sphingomonas sp.]|uniref:type IV secretion system protein n=1 Tax=Sphingomonas sp. TaxID=28214 RepID=UPI0025D4C59E|nr:type IV secretion system protein [Sphingomonas sp.]MBV9528436.1 type IV secretion system protein [Sphingomonas sp.]